MVGHLATYFVHIPSHSNVKLKKKERDIKMSFKNLIETSKQVNWGLLDRFLNAAVASTLQDEFYTTKDEQTSVVINLHKELIENNREVYAVSLLLPLNIIHKQLIIKELLSNPITNKVQMDWENWLMLHALTRMQINKSYQTFMILRACKVNNKRTRWLCREFFNSRKNIAFEAVKYKKKVKTLIRHAHIKPTETTKEVFSYLFDKVPVVTTEILKDSIAAKTSKDAALRLPLSIARGYAKLHDISDEELYSNVKMSAGEKRRVQNKAKEAGVKVNVNWEQQAPIQMLKYLRTLNLQATENRWDLGPSKKYYEGFMKSCANIAGKIPFGFKSIRVIIDNSQSMYGSKEKKFHPISVAEAVNMVVSNLSEDQNTYPTPNGGVFLSKVFGSTDLTDQLINALKDKPELLIIISDGYENAPAGMARQIIEAYYKKIDRTKETTILHINPVFAPEAKDIKKLHEDVITMGIRDTKQLMLILLLTLIKAKNNKTLQKVLNELKAKVKVKGRNQQ